MYYQVAIQFKTTVVPVTHPSIVIRHRRKVVFKLFLPFWSWFHLENFHKFIWKMYTYTCFNKPDTNMGKKHPQPLFFKITRQLCNLTSGKKVSWHCKTWFKSWFKLGGVVLIYKGWFWLSIILWIVNMESCFYHSGTIIDWCFYINFGLSW